MSGDETFRTQYPDYDVLEKWNSPSWNDVTRRVIEKRLKDVPQQQFFTEHEWNTLEAVCNRLVPQPDRPHNPVPIVPWIDEKLQQHGSDGYRYYDIPPMQVAWRKGLRGIDQESERLFGRSFMELSAGQQDGVLKAIQKGEVKGDAWEGMNVRRFFSSALLKQVVATYYAHPAAWSEIGFGGPASPRGYVRLGMDKSDSWEAKESKQPQVRR
jgi:hypothetical protein